MAHDSNASRLRLDLLDRYLAGECSVDERATIEAWLAKHPAQAARLAIQQTERTQDWARILASVQSQPVAPMRNARISSNRSAFQFAWRPVAGFALILGLAAIVFWRTPRTLRTTRSDVREYATGIGQRATINLVDGSRVILAPGTTLAVPATFDQNTRTVTLNGEAYFEVTTTSGMPFIVRTATVATRVLGTAFNVQSYATDPQVRVAVVTGKVSIAATTGRVTPTVLTEGMTGIVHDSARPQIIPNDAERSTAWTTGQLVFRDAPLPEVLAALTRWYGYRFRVADSTLVGENLTLGISTQSSATAFTTLKQVLNVDLVFVDSTVTLKRRLRHDGWHRIPEKNDRILPTHTEIGK